MSRCRFHRFALCVATFVVASSFTFSAASAQTPPPPFDEYERVRPTIRKRLAIHFSLGAFVGRFEETRLDTVRKAVGEGSIRHQGDAAGSMNWLCYRRARHRLWVVSHGEMGGPDQVVTEVVAEITETDDAGASTDCAIIPEKFSHVVLDGKLHLGMSRREAIAALGSPSKAEAARMVYFHAGKIANGFDETAWLQVGFREDKIVFMRGGKTTLN